MNNTQSELPPYEIISGDAFVTVKVSGSPNASLIPEFEKALDPICAGPKPLIINGEHLIGFGAEWIGALVKVATKKKAIGQDIILIQLSPSVLNELKTAGVLNVLKTQKTLRMARIALGLEKQKGLDVDFVNPFIFAVVNVLKIQAETTCRPQTPVLRQNSAPIDVDISGIIGITSESFSGSVVISFPEKTFLKVMSRMIGEECTAMNPEIVDGVGELTNIIFGQAKVSLNEKGYGIKTAIPSIVSGKGHTVQNLGDGPVVSVPFESDAGTFFVEICIS